MSSPLHIRVTFHQSGTILQDVKSLEFVRRCGSGQKSEGMRFPKRSPESAKGRFEGWCCRDADNPPAAGDKNSRKPGARGPSVGIRQQHPCTKSAWDAGRIDGTVRSKRSFSRLGYVRAGLADSPEDS